MATTTSLSTSASIISFIPKAPKHVHVHILAVYVGGLAQLPLALEACFLEGAERCLVAREDMGVDPVEVQVAKGEIRERSKRLRAEPTSAQVRGADPDLHL